MRVLYKKNIYFYKKLKTFYEIKFDYYHMEEHWFKILEDSTNIIKYL